MDMEEHIIRNYSNYIHMATVWVAAVRPRSALVPPKQRSPALLWKRSKPSHDIVQNFITLTSITRDYQPCAAAYA